MPAIIPPSDLADRLAPLTLREAGGARVTLGDLWAQRPAVLVHLRHFG